MSHPLDPINRPVSATGPMSTPRDPMSVERDVRVAAAKVLAKYEGGARTFDLRAAFARILIEVDEAIAAEFAVGRSSDPEPAEGADRMSTEPRTTEPQAVMEIGCPHSFGIVYRRRMEVLSGFPSDQRLIDAALAAERPSGGLDVVALLEAWQTHIAVDHDDAYTTGCLPVDLCLKGIAARLTGGQDE